MKTDVFRVEVFKRTLRDYYNEAVAIIEDLDNEEITYSASEKALMQLDQTYAERMAQL